MCKHKPTDATCSRLFRANLESPTGTVGSLAKIEFGDDRKPGVADTEVPASHKLPKCRLKTILPGQLCFMDTNSDPSVFASSNGDSMSLKPLFSPSNRDITLAHAPPWPEDKKATAGVLAPPFITSPKADAHPDTSACSIEDVMVGTKPDSDK